MGIRKVCGYQGSAGVSAEVSVGFYFILGFFFFSSQLVFFILYSRETFFKDYGCPYETALSRAPAGTGCVCGPWNARARARTRI